MSDPPTEFAGETARGRRALPPSTPAWLTETRNLRRLIYERSQELCDSVQADVGRTPAEVLATDILPFADACRFLERRAAGILKPRRIPRSDMPLWTFGSRDAVHRRPWGVVGIIGTWNYPILLNGVPILQALVAGNAVLWKPSELSVRLAESLRKLFVDAGFPADLLQVLPATREAGPQLLEADIDHLVFTGSDGVGRKIAVRCAERLIPCTLELSGCDALIVGRNADLAMAAKASWYGITLNGGQTCIAVRRIFVSDDTREEFEQALIAAAVELRDYRLALPGQVACAGELVRDARIKGAKLLFPADPHFGLEPPAMPAVVLTNVDVSMRVAHEAAFAPIAGILAYSDEADLLNKLSASPFALGCSIFDRDVKGAERLAAKLAPGMVVINDVLVPAAHPGAPFGGRGRSGWGTTQGAEGLLAMTVPQLVSRRRGSFRPHYAAANGGIDAGTARMLNGMLKWKHGRDFGRRISGFWNVLRGATQVPKENRR